MLGRLYVGPIGGIMHRPNKDGLPVGLRVQADVDGVGEVTLKVDKRKYTVVNVNGVELTGGKNFNSLSQSAEFFSKIKRKSGWVYWRLQDGRTLKEVYKG